MKYFLSLTRDEIRLKARFLFIIFILASLVTVVYSLYYEVQKKPLYLEVAFLDVGQGDAILITTPAGRQVLIDGGPDALVLHGLGYVMNWWDRKIDVVIATHPDKDHIGGLVDVLERYRIERVIDHQVPLYEKSETGFKDEKGHNINISPTETYQAYTRARKDSTHQDIDGGMLKIGDGVLLHMVAFPDEESSNNKSLIVFVEYQDVLFALTGDIDLSVEKRLVAYLKNKKPDMLKNKKEVIFKASHHGSKTGSSKEILEYLQPTHVVYSAGKDNHFGHPHQDVKDRVSKIGSKSTCTCDVGHIVFQTEGVGIFVDSEK